MWCHFDDDDDDHDDFFFRPFGQCAEVLTPQTVEQYFLPIVVSTVLYIIILHNFIARLLAGVKGKHFQWKSWKGITTVNFLVSLVNTDLHSSCTFLNIVQVNNSKISCLNVVSSLAG